MKFAYKPGVRYRVFEDMTEVLSTVSAGQTPITKAIQAGAAKLLYGKIASVTIQGDDGTLLAMTVNVTGPEQGLASHENVVAFLDNLGVQ